MEAVWEEAAWRDLHDEPDNDDSQPLTNDILHQTNASIDPQNRPSSRQIARPPTPLDSINPITSSFESPDQVYLISTRQADSRDSDRDNRTSRNSHLALPVLADIAQDPGAYPGRRLEANNSAAASVMDFESSQEMDQHFGVPEPWDINSDEATALFVNEGSPPSSIGGDDAQSRHGRENIGRQGDPVSDPEDLFVSDQRAASDIGDAEHSNHDFLMLDMESWTHGRVHGDGRPSVRRRSRFYRDGLADMSRWRLQRGERIEREARRGERRSRVSSGFRDMLRPQRNRSSSPRRHDRMNFVANRSSDQLNSHPDDRGDARDLGRIGIDELVEVEFGPPRASSHRRGHPSHQNSNNRSNPRPLSLASLNENPEIIDLTEDSPPLAPFERAMRPDPIHQSQHRNPRRSESRFPLNPPVLARSDGSALRAQLAGANVIDLTDDADEPGNEERLEDDGGEIQYLGGRSAPAHIQLDDYLAEPGNQSPVNRIVLSAIDHFGGLPRVPFPNFLGSFTFGRNASPNVNRNQPAEMSANPNPLGPNGMPNLNYGVAAFVNNVGVNGGSNGHRGKPSYKEPSPAPEGFTRNTGDLGFEGDEIAVCPGCDNELAYDPDSDGGDLSQKATSVKANRSGSAKKPKKKLEHRFWALRECGHVYCSKCYSNRTTRTTDWKHTLWRLPNGAVADGTTWKPIDDNLDIKEKGKIFCAVDNCKTNIKPQSAWVGIFM